LTDEHDFSINPKDKLKIGRGNFYQEKYFGNEKRKKNRFSILVKFQDGILSLNYLSAIQSSGIFTFLSKKQVTYWKNIGTAMVK
jgi:hypothetical protein